ncbi:iron uptake regulator [Oxalicibacterium flavum]|uniref:Iron uptake regulator n=1 Tax=Oxalicibacterium flavum TaxID=179467 RepID=A0A8J2ULD0_9BURK|nr:FecR family protein [Oxalicibacterium flavum]GGC09728.1 iron uptake regulator [Oxalicibacterium flavum]
MTTTNPTADIDPVILREAADWLMRLHAGDAGPADWEAVDRWRSTSAAHSRAWQRAEGLLGDLRALPQGPVRTALEQPNARRRQLLRLLWLPALPAGWLAWRHVSIDGERWQTATGEQRSMTLADGTQLLLNTGTEIAVQFNAETRLIRLLAGEILVTSAPDPAPTPRPLVIATADGTARPIGTRFAVRRAAGEQTSRVAVFEGMVEVESAGQRRQVEHGYSIVFGPDGPAMPEKSDNAADEAWTNGMIVARRMRLADLLAELDRYRPGLLRCHPEVADLRVSGTFPALEPERSLHLLAASFPLQVRYRTRYWVTVEPA